MWECVCVFFKRKKEKERELKGGNERIFANAGNYEHVEAKR